jgi:hypothetical protein
VEGKESLVVEPVENHWNRVKGEGVPQIIKSLRDLNLPNQRNNFISQSFQEAAQRAQSLKIVFSD